MNNTPPTYPAHILLCTLGASWAVIPEIVGWLAPHIVDLYRHHPQRAQLDALRDRHQLHPPAEIWICTTEGKQTANSLAQLHQWWQHLGTPLPLRIWTAAGTDQLASQDECAHIRELILRTTLLAHERTSATAGLLYLSLAGGRKTMSADLQTAGSLFGSHALLHVVGPDPLPPALLGKTDGGADALRALLCTPLPAEMAAAVTPLVAGTGQRSEWLDLVMDSQTVSSKHFGLPLPQPGEALSWFLPPTGDTLYQELQLRQQQSNRLMGNFLAEVAAAEHHENWRSLYRLPPARIQQLRQTPLNASHRDWLEQLPKADLHRHLGGCLDLPAQRQVAQAIWETCTASQRESSLRLIKPLLQQAQWPWEWPETLKPPPHHDQAPLTQRAHHTAALLLHASETQLQHNLFGMTEPRVALKHRHPHGFAAYERPGELTGSAMLGHPAAIDPYARAIVAQARREGLLYLELRGSPHKYCPDDPQAFLIGLRNALHAAGARVDGSQPANIDAPRIGFLWILDRRQPHSHATIVQQAVQAHQNQRLDGFLLGLDLAGDEGTHAPEQLAQSFTHAFIECLPITIHAGEGESAENIWQAAYHLHADRIGHGLTLADVPRLAARFRDRSICLELCPTSNREVVGFADPDHPASAGLPHYPLRSFLLEGVPFTICTDNPGISRTTLADEYLAAARMSEDGLSQWDALALMKQAFLHAFLPSAEREIILKQADQIAFKQLSTS